MRKNVGTVDAMIRITAGLVGLAYGVGRMSRRPYRTPWLLMALSAMKVAEGATRFCPMLYAMDTETVTNKGVNKMVGKMTQAGVRAAMNRMTGAKSGSGSEAQARDKENASQITTDMTSQRTSAHTHDLSPEDKQLETAVRNFVSSADDFHTTATSDAREKSTPSERYSRDEHFYPTYS
ncbi:DUF2892 domain-containing protein [Brevibacillus ruminantium]|uniref:DUF2892 domain-containing protein n=1 Tax=Brevibacillus ruminantium TaxID=2950604 RepID=A0ABY4WH44_9BACL|nr:DUF2892 domain-containing protein [Brevibacillus ruminantium]USG66412.1 DUF2892 domain-containing protein [Brevibacillus ruminantium]